MNYPKITLIIWSCTSFFMIVYLIILRPFDKFRHNVNQIGCEFITITMYIMVAVQSQFNESDVDEKSNFGFKMLLVNDGLFIWNTMTSYLEIACLALEAIIEKRKSKKLEKEKLKVDEVNLENIVLTLRENSLDDDDDDDDISSIKDSYDINTEVLIKYFHDLIILFTCRY